MTAERICRNDKSHKETETASATSSITKEPTAAEEGEHTYTVIFENPAFEKQVKVEKIPKLVQYTMRFVDWEGTELQSGLVTEGETPSYTGATPTKAADAQYTYTFAGWTPEIAAVTGKATYMATYNVDLDTVLDKAVTGEATYTATYSSTVNQYTVTFVDYDGKTVLKEATSYDYGTQHLRSCSRIRRRGKQTTSTAMYSPAGLRRLQRSRKTPPTRPLIPGRRSLPPPPIH